MFKLDLRIPLLLGVACLLAVSTSAQIAATRARNNPYSPSPDGRQKSVEIVPADTAMSMIKTAAVDPPKTRQVVPPIVESNVPTEIYKVGVGDVLLVEVKNVSQGSGYYTIRETGTIEFQLAGGEIIVAGKSPAAIAREIADRITLFPDPQVEVTVREYGSHKITVAGLVDHPGEKSLQREAMPLFVIIAEAGVKPSATRAVVTRAPLLKPETYQLNDGTAQDVLIYPGNSIEFVEGLPSRGVYFIAGNVVSPGQKDLAAGLTLYQSLAAAGGTKTSAKKGLIRRRDDRGVLAVMEFNLRSIRDGKTADPQLQAGDVVEIGN